MTAEPLHETVLRVVFLTSPEKPVNLSTDDIFWKLEEPYLTQVKLKEVLEWLTRKGDLNKDLGKYVLARPTFFELKKRYGTVQVTKPDPKSNTKRKNAKTKSAKDSKKSVTQSPKKPPQELSSSHSKIPLRTSQERTLRQSQPSKSGLEELNHSTKNRAQSEQQLPQQKHSATITPSVSEVQQKKPPSAISEETKPSSMNDLTPKPVNIPSKILPVALLASQALCLIAIVITLLMKSAQTQLFQWSAFILLALQTLWGGLLYKRITQVKNEN